MNYSTSVVITTINKPNGVIKKIYSLCTKNKIDFIIIGDKKTPKYPKKFPLIDLKTQKKNGFSISKLLPENSYSRKNIGYLIAMKNKSNLIIETDDDNMPKTNFFKGLELKKKVKEINGPKWINILDIFSKRKKLIWPRGFPIDLITKNQKVNFRLKEVITPIQQRMCDGNPDVDAIFRLTNKNLDYKFKKQTYSISNNSLTPFNSQNTVWHLLAFPIMYLPSFCTMRATDIWRSFIALRLLKNYKWNLTFSDPTVFQFRNYHNLMNDFIQEIPVYKNTIQLNKIINNLKLSKNPKDILRNQFKCYEALVKNKIFDKEELELLYFWSKDINKIYNKLNKI